MSSAIVSLQSLSTDQLCALRHSLGVRTDLDEDAFQAALETSLRTYDPLRGPLPPYLARIYFHNRRSQFRRARKALPLKKTLVAPEQVERTNERAELQTVYQRTVQELQAVATCGYATVAEAKAARRALSFLTQLYQLALADELDAFPTKQARNTYLRAQATQTLHEPISASSAENALTQLRQALAEQLVAAGLSVTLPGQGRRGQVTRRPGGQAVEPADIEIELEI